MKDNIEGFPGYHITRDGCLYSRYNNIGKLTNSYKKNKAYSRSNGYQQIVLKIRSLNKLRRAYIHRLVAESYIPNPENKPCVCHKDNNRANNHVDNLYWGTYKENSEQMVRDNHTKKGKVIRAIIFSDLHLHNWKNHTSRSDTAIRVLKIISDICIRKKIPALFCGDLLHDPKVLDYELADIIYREFPVLDKKPWNMYGISGNHTMYYSSTTGSNTFSWDKFLNYSFYKNIDFKRIHYKNLYIYGVPYIDNNVGLTDYLKNVDVSVGGTNSKHILMLHTDYPGAKDNDGREIGSVENLNLNILNKFDLVLCGHIHKPQRLSKKVYMIGAPYQQRRTDKDSKLGYWELYSDLSMKFKELNDFPKFIDVESEDEIKDDGNYYTLIPKKEENTNKSTTKIHRNLSKNKLARQYLRENGIKDKDKSNLLKRILKEAEND